MKSLTRQCIEGAAFQHSTHTDTWRDSQLSCFCGGRYTVDTHKASPVNHLVTTSTQLCEASRPVGRQHLYDVGLNIVDSYTDNCNPEYVNR